MKKRDLERELRDLGWWKSGDSGPHEKWTNGEINEFTARGILREARQHPPLPKEGR